MAAARHAPTTTIDLMDDTLAAKPWPALAQLREQGPVIWHETQQRWLITTDQAIREVVLNSDRFTVQGTVVEELFGSDAFIAMDERLRHNQLRNIWANAFRPQALHALRNDIIALVNELLSPLCQQLLDGETVNVSDALCRPLPTLVIARMMGVPREQLDDVVRWSDAMAGGGPAYLDPVLRDAAIRAREEAKVSLANCLQDLIDQRRRHPADDLIGLLATAEAAQGLSDGQLIQNLRQLLFAGNETTARWLGHLFVAYGRDSAVQRQIATDRSLIRAANEEVLRWQGVIGTLPRRVCGGDIAVAGMPLADGDHITCLLASANRDPARFHEPDRFDIHRKPEPHLGFGAGLHNCLGAALARLEVELAMNGLFDRIPAFHQLGEVHYTALPVRGPQAVCIARGDA